MKPSTNKASTSQAETTPQGATLATEDISEPSTSTASADEFVPTGPTVKLVQITADEADELDMLRAVVFTLMSKVATSRGKNVTVRLDNVFAVMPELAHQGVIPKLNYWFEHRQRLVVRDQIEAEQKAKALRDAAMAKLSPEERKALGL